MLDVATIVGSIVGIVGGATGIVSMVNQRKQTQIMEIGLERAFELPEGETGKGFERKIRTLLTKRLYDTRTRLKQEFDTRINQIEQELKADHIMEYKHILTNLSDLLRDGKTISDVADDVKRIRGEILATQESIQTQSGRNSDEIVALEREITQLQQRVEDMRKGIGVHDSVLKRMRSIAEQLLQITSQPETARHDAMIEPNDVANQNETAGQDWMMVRDKIVGQDSFYGNGE